MGRQTILLGLGSNLPGGWGESSAILARAMRELCAGGLEILRISSPYSTAPLGGGCQPRYLNAVIEAVGSIQPAALLRLAKRIEREAGRRLGRHWGPRTLDIDVLDFAGRQIGNPHGRRQRGRLVLPHPEMHRRAFVLRPLQEVAPHWRHPRLGVSAGGLLARLTSKERDGVRRISNVRLDSAGLSCEKQAT